MAYPSPMVPAADERRPGRPTGRGESHGSEPSPTIDHGRVTPPFRCGQAPIASLTSFVYGSPVEPAVGRLPTLVVGVDTTQDVTDDRIVY